MIITLNSRLSDLSVATTICVYIQLVYITSSQKNYISCVECSSVYNRPLWNYLMQLTLAMVNEIVPPKENTFNKYYRRKLRKNSYEPVAGYEEMVLAF